MDRRRARARRTRDAPIGAGRRARASPARRRKLEPMPVALETVALQKHFGGIAAVAGVSLTIEKGARHALIGPNGAGKTTVINLLTGVLTPTAGRILLDGRDITTLPPHRRVARGLARTFQINQLFADLTALDTLGLAVSERAGAGTD